jgi:hypothetical protein
MNTLVPNFSLVKVNKLSMCLCIVLVSFITKTDINVFLSVCYVVINSSFAFEYKFLVSKSFAPLLSSICFLFLASVLSN